MNAIFYLKTIRRAMLLCAAALPLFVLSCNQLDMEDALEPLSISITAQPTTTSYNNIATSNWNVAGMKVTALMPNGAAVEIPNITTDNITPSFLDATKDTTQWTVSYAGKTAVVNGITVKKAESVTLSGSPTKKEYYKILKDTAWAASTGLQYNVAWTGGGTESINVPSGDIAPTYPKAQEKAWQSSTKNAVVKWTVTAKNGVKLECADDITVNVATPQTIAINAQPTKKSYVAASDTDWDIGGMTFDLTLPGGITLSDKAASTFITTKSIEPSFASGKGVASSWTIRLYGQTITVTGITWT